MQSFVGTDRNEMWFGASSNSEGGERRRKKMRTKMRQQRQAPMPTPLLRPTTRASLMRAMGITASPDEATTSSGSGPEVKPAHGAATEREGPALRSPSQPVSQSVSPSVRQSVSQSVSQSVRRSVSQSVSQSVGPSVSQSISQSSVRQSVVR